MNNNNELELFRERYLKLVDAHGELQNQNSLLEERILSVVENYSNEKSQFEQDLLDAKQQIVHLKDTINELEIEKQRYKDDCNLAVRLLHQHPNEFISTTSHQSVSELITSQTSTNQFQHAVIIPTFPPAFVTPLPLFNATNFSSSDIDETTTVTNDNRYPSIHFICSNCRETIKCYDVSVQTSLEDPDTISQKHVVSLTASDDRHYGSTTSISFEPHNHPHMTVKEYQQGSTRRLSHDARLSLNSIPQMHHV